MRMLLYVYARNASNMRATITSAAPFGQRLPDQHTAAPIHAPAPPPPAAPHPPPTPSHRRRPLTPGRPRIQTPCRQVLHALAFIIGGTTFIAGTLALFFPGYETLSALLYTIGSCG